MDRSNWLIYGLGLVFGVLLLMGAPVDPVDVQTHRLIAEAEFHQAVQDALVDCVLDPDCEPPFR